MRAEVAMVWLLLACGGPPEAPPEAAAPTADEILSRHLAVTRQCDLLERDSFVFQWKASTRDGHSRDKVEQIRLQGRAGRSFTRIHQHRQPNVRFIAFGQTPEGQVWSAGDAGLQTELPPDVVASLKGQLDPTPLCNFGARWPVRTLVGPEMFQEFPAWKLELVWSDGTPTEMWFHRESGLLMGSRSRVADALSTTTLTDYAPIPCPACSGDVLWPRKETALREQGPLKITTEQVLEAFAIDAENFADIGPEQVAQAIVDARDGD